MVAPTAGSATLTEPDCALVSQLLPSPNFGDRRGRAVDALILHYTGMASGEAALARLRDPTSEVSCHYLVWEDGRVEQLVAEADRAWHAGRSFWAGETDLNSVSIGIEIVNGGHEFGLPPYPPAQIEALVALCQDVCVRRGISRTRVLGHSDIAPDRKLDPGELFPWPELAKAGLGLWVAPPSAMSGAVLEIGDEGEAVAALQRHLTALGVCCEATGRFDAGTRDAVTAVQRHWRPAGIDGRADPATLALLRALIDARGA